MGILDNLLGANVDPMQMQIASLLGVQMDPKQLQRRSRAEGLSRIGQALMQAGGGASGTLSALGAGLQNARGAGDDVVGRELQRAMQFKQLQESQAQLKARAAMQEQMKTLLPQALKNLPPEVAQLVSLQAASGDPTMMNKAFETILNPPQPKTPSNKAQLAFAAANGDANAQAALERLNADELARAQAGRTNVSVGAPDIAGAINAALDAAGKGRGKAFEEEVQSLGKNAQGLSEYANNLEAFNALAGDAQTLGGETGVKAKELWAAAGLPGVDPQRLARERAAVSLQTKTGIAELANFKGPTTDFEFNKVLEAGPALQQSPEGRKAMAAFARERAQQQQRIAEIANDLSAQVEAGQKTIAQAREELRRAQEQRWLTPSTTNALQLLGVDFGKQGGNAAPAQPAAGPKRFKFNADGTLTEG